MNRSKAKALPQAAQDVLSERDRQIWVEGWATDHDDEHSGGEMALAAACYAAYPFAANFCEGVWPWDWKWWKPRERRDNLVRAGALILAEIERLDRAKSGAS